MIENTKEPRSPVSKERAREHALLTIRRAWAGGVPDFERWGGFELDPEPLVIHDLNGQVLCYEFGVMDGNELVGSVKASASKIIGSAVPMVEFGPRGWNPDEACKKAKAKVEKRFPNVNITGTELLCYSYPKIGVRVYIDDPKLGSQSLILDVASLSFVESFGTDELVGFTAWSFYHEVAERNASEREQRWELADRELEAVRSVTPKIFERAFTADELKQIKPTLILQPVFRIPSYSFYSYRTVQSSPRCPIRSHECFALYSQETHWYCAPATVQMILDFYRYYYTQDEIATTLQTRAPPDFLASGGTSPEDIMNGLESLSYYSLRATLDETPRWDKAKARIDANQPLASGIFGHIRACAGWMRQNISLIDQEPKRWLKIYDPLPWNADPCQGGKVLWEDWDTENHTNFIYVRETSYFGL